MHTRRKFLQQSALIAAGFLLPQEIFAAGKKKKIGLQMYTLRNVIKQNNIASVLTAIAKIGYRELEIFGYSGRDKFWGMEPKPFKALLKANGLKAPAAHISFENFLTGKDETELRLICEAANILGNEFVVVAWLKESLRTTAADYRLLADRLNKAAVIAHQYGLQLAYHNHDFEFKTLEPGVTGYDILLKETDEQLVKMELDLFWAVKAGKDPLILFEENPGRFPLWHVKDMDKASGSFTEVGTGSINFQQLFGAAKTAGLQHYFIEQDEVKKDVFTSITESYGYAARNLSF